MIKNIRVKNLYGRYNYNFDLSKSVITIISGPNGYGKTTLLKAIRDVLDDDLLHLASIPFEELELETVDNKKLLFKKDGWKMFVNGERLFVPLTINGTGKKDERTFFTLRSEDIEDIKKAYNKLFINQQQLLTITYVIYDGDDELDGFTSEDLLLRINAQLAETKKLNCIRDLLSFYKSVGNSIYSGADRLYREYGINDGHLGKRVLKEVIADLPKQLEEVFKVYDNDYTGISNKLDYFFMSDLSDEIKESAENPNAGYTKSDYEKDKEIIEKQRSKLISYNFIIDKSKLPKSSLEFNEKYSLVFKVFNKNYKSKLMVLKELTDKLDLFLKVINTKFSNKKMIISRTNVADSIIVKDGDNVIPLRDLSSGEKEIILMYFKLIFEADRDVIALIDEPELSSHVSWQYEVLDDFDKIIKVNKNVKQVIVCTHSPQIVNDRWNQTIDLFTEDKK